MSKLTDLEICKKIALIEDKYTDLINKQASYNSRLVHVQEKATIKRWFNPLTDDALCFKLMVKHKISLIQHQNNTAVYCIWNHDEKHATSTMTNANLAICLAIIESKEIK